MMSRIVILMLLKLCAIYCMFADRGVGEHGLILSSFCGPLAITPTHEEDESILKFSFLVNEVHLHGVSGKGTVRLPYHITHNTDSHTHSNIILDWTGDADALIIVRQSI
jgi:hypothetical protein